MQNSVFPTCIGKGAGKLFSHSHRIQCGGKHGYFFETRGLCTEESSSVFGSLYNGSDSLGSCPSGYNGARILLNLYAVPDVPLHINSENYVVLPPGPRGAFMKRRKADFSNLLDLEFLFCCIMLLFTGKVPLFDRYSS